MRIAKVRISNVLGVDELEFDAGSFNAVTGPNGSGKTSVLEAIKAMGDGAQDATLLRQGAAAGEIVLVLEDGGELRKRVTPSGVTNTVINGDGTKSARPASAMKALFDRMSNNPVDFLNAKPQDRVDVLLGALPMEVDDARLSEILGAAVETAAGVTPLQAIDRHYQTIFDERTGTNRAIREKENTINQLAAALPDEGSVPAGGAAELETALAAIDAAKDTKLADIDGKMTGYRAESQARADVIQGEIDELRNKLQAERDWLTTTEAKAGQAKSGAIQAHATERAPIAEKLAGIRANADAFARAAQTRDTIKTMRLEADSLVADEKRQTAILESLKSYKSDLLASLPIDGLEVRGKEIFRHDIPFDRLNTQQRVEIAVEIAKLRAGPLGVICVDGIELMDTEHYEGFRERALESDLQLFVTRVSDGEFAVQTHS